ncbi:hypothetical protein BGX33_012203 [Mortierella sp. NVP41]|nr:hypothetical protein BGX33_012203 [Mortierella sp. NVP41]
MKWQASDAVRVNKLFKKVPLSGWNFDDFCKFHQADLSTIDHLFERNRFSLNLLLESDKHVPEKVKLFVQGYKDAATDSRLAAKKTQLQLLKDQKDTVDGAIATGAKAFETLGRAAFGEQKQKQQQLKDQLEHTQEQLEHTQEQLEQTQVQLEHTRKTDFVRLWINLKRNVYKRRTNSNRCRTRWLQSHRPSRLW